MLNETVQHVHTQDVKMYNYTRSKLDQCNVSKNLRI